MLSEIVDTTTTGTATQVAVRSCDGCTLCCKVMEVKSLAKPNGKWCPHCQIGKGCGIYEERPFDCTAFMCGYLTVPQLGPEWKPAHSRLIVSGPSEEGTIHVDVDPERPDAWRKQPYYNAIKAWAERALPKGRRVVVRLHRRSIVILPDRAVDLGVLAADELICVVSGSTLRSGEATHEAYAVQKDVWGKHGFDVAQGKVTPLALSGFRAGWRID